jgi:hypothetical protein
LYATITFLLTPAPNPGEAKNIGVIVEVDATAPVRVAVKSTGPEADPQEFFTANVAVLLVFGALITDSGVAVTVTPQAAAAAKSEPVSVG